jgi:RNA:NAD 2'-phosphotransferase (TPT1/KptA family)
LITSGKVQLARTDELLKARQDFTNAVQQAQQLFNIANDRMRFINETYVHLARFLTNSQVSELEFSQNRVSTFVDTNKTFGNSYSVTAGTNIVVKKVPLEKLTALPQ